MLVMLLNGLEQSANRNGGRPIANQNHWKGLHAQDAEAAVSVNTVASRGLARCTSYVILVH